MICTRNDLPVVPVRILAFPLERPDSAQNISDQVIGVLCPLRGTVEPKVLHLVDVQVSDKQAQRAVLRRVVVDERDHVLAEAALVFEEARQRIDRRVGSLQIDQFGGEKSEVNQELVYDLVFEHFIVAFPVGFGGIIWNGFVAAVAEAAFLVAALIVAGFFRRIGVLLHHRGDTLLEKLAAKVNAVQVCLEDLRVGVVELYDRQVWKLCHLLHAEVA